MTDQLQAKLERPVKRTYTIGVRLEGTTRKQRRQNELRANEIIRDLQQTIGQLVTPTKMDETLRFVRQEKFLSGTKGAGKIATYFKDRSNLGQVAYVTLLAAANGILDRERKIQQFSTFLQEDQQAAVEWLIFGRSPYLEWKLQHRLMVAYDYSRNLIHSARRTLDPHLSPEHQLLSSLPEISRKEILVAIEQFFHSIIETFTKEEKLSLRQKSFNKKLTLIHQHRQLITEALYRWILEWNSLIKDSSPHLSRWRQFKQFTRGVEEWVEIITEKKIRKYSYLSVLRGCLVSALFPWYQEGKTVKKLIENGTICAEHLTAKPFRNNPIKPKKTNKGHSLIPLSLLMGSKYVVGRPGSSTVMTKLATKENGFAITIWPPRRKKETLVAQLRFHRRLREMFANGAKLALLILRSTPGPSGKILIELVLEGQYWMFLSKRCFENLPLEIQLPVEPIKGIGLDINRISRYMLTYSEEVTLPADVHAAIRHYLHLEQVLKKLHRGLTIHTRLCENNIEPSSSVHQARYKKLILELTLVYARRARIRKELHRLSCTVTTQVLLKAKSPIFCVEDLQLTARGTRYALAKAILNMPDEIDLYERAILLVFYLTGTTVAIRRVDPRSTSQGKHIDCSANPVGKVLRSRDSYDLAPCSACGSLVNTHHNAACLIRDKGLLQVCPP